MTTECGGRCECDGRWRCVCARMCVSSPCLCAHGRVLVRASECERINKMCVMNMVFNVTTFTNQSVVVSERS